MTNLEREFAALGFEYAEGIETFGVITVPTTGREIRRRKSGLWEAQPWNDNYWNEFKDLLDAAIFASKIVVKDYVVSLERSPEGGYTVTVPALPGCISEGRTIGEAKGNIAKAIKLYETNRQDST